MTAEQWASLVEQMRPWLQGAAVLGLLFWLRVVLDARRWWPAQWSLHLDSAARQGQPGVIGDLIVVVPARNEASMLPRTLPRLLKQGTWYRRLIVVDDNSRDQTASIARRLAVGSDAEDKLTVVSLGDDDGPAGKVRALLAGVQEAEVGWEGEPDRQWFLFTSADVLHTTSSLARITSKAETENLDLVSVMVRLRSRDFWEWLLIPPFVYFFQLLYPFRKASDPASRVAAAAGGCILVRRSVLESIGGLEGFSETVSDDIALARAIKRAGGSCWLGIDPDLTSLRTYDGYGMIARMVERTAFAQLRHNYALLVLTWIAIALFFVGPPLLAAYGAITLDPILGVSAAVAFLLSLANFLPVVQYHDTPSGFVVTLPIAAILYGWMATRSAFARMSGKSVESRPAVQIDRTRE